MIMRAPGAPLCSTFDIVCNCGGWNKSFPSVVLRFDAELGYKDDFSGSGGRSRGGLAVSGKFSGCRSLLIEVLVASHPRVCLSDRKVLG